MLKIKGTGATLSPKQIEIALWAGIRKFQYTVNMKRKEGTTEQKAMMVLTYLENSSQRLVDVAEKNGVTNEEQLGALSLIEGVVYEGLLNTVLREEDDLAIFMAVEYEE